MMAHVDVEKLVAFIRARRGDDRALAGDVLARFPPPSWSISYALPDGTRLIVSDGSASVIGSVDGGVAHHVARWDPARAATEANASLARVAFLAGVAAGQVVLGESHADQEVQMAYAQRLLAWEANPFSWHPDYQQEWADHE